MIHSLKIVDYLHVRQTSHFPKAITSEILIMGHDILVCVDRFNGRLGTGKVIQTRGPEGPEALT